MKKNDADHDSLKLSMLMLMSMPITKKKKKGKIHPYIMQQTTPQSVYTVSYMLLSHPSITPHFVIILMLPIKKCQTPFRPSSGLCETFLSLTLSFSTVPVESTLSDLEMGFIILDDEYSERGGQTYRCRLTNYP